MKVAEANNTVNLHIFLSSCTNESRLLKETRALTASDLFSDVHIIGIWEKGLAEHEQIDPARSLWRVVVRSRGMSKHLAAQTLKYCEWAIRSLCGMRSQRISVVHVHSLPALPVGVLFKLFWRSKLIYDAHELETERNGLGGARKRLAKAAERLFIRFADATLVVSDSIADWYRDAYLMPRPQVIRNVPEPPRRTASAAPKLKEQLGLKESDLLFIYQGGISAGRGIEQMLRIFERTAADRHIVFMGKGTLADAVRQRAGRHANIHWIPPVHPDDILSYTAGADAGLSMIENTCLSYYYSLPNKLFEYLLSGLPVLINDLPDQKKIVERYGCGWIVPGDDDAAVRMIDSLSTADLAAGKTAAAKAREWFSWDREVRAMLDVYR